MGENILYRCKTHRKIKFKKFSLSLSIVFFKFQAVAAM